MLPGSGLDCAYADFSKEIELEDAGRTAHWGAPQQALLTERAGKTYGGSVASAKKGGVATIVNLEIPTRKLAATWDEKIAELCHTGRVVVTMMECGRHHRPLGIFNVYGYSGASGGPTTLAFERNERLLKLTFEVAATMGDQPILIVGDLQIDTRASPTIAAAMADLQWQDAAMLSGEMQGNDLPATRKAGGIRAIEQRKIEVGATRIDAMLLNMGAATMFHDLGYNWDMQQTDHTPLTLRLRPGNLKSDMIVCEKTDKLDLTEMSAVTPEEGDEIYDFVRKKSCEREESSVADLYRRKDQEKLAKRIARHDAAYLMERGAKPVTKDKTNECGKQTSHEVAAEMRRMIPPIFRRKSLQAPWDRMGKSTTTDAMIIRWAVAKLHIAIAVAKRKKLLYLP